MSFITAVDFSFMHWLNHFVGKSQIFDALIYYVSDANILKGMPLAAYFWWQWFSANEDIARRRRTIVVATIGALAAVLIARILQRTLPFHARPLHTPALNFVLADGVNPDMLSGWSSFPSDHAALFFAFSIGIWWVSRRDGVIAMLWTLAVICFPRMYLGYHFPSDVVGGVILGLAIGGGAQALFKGSTFPERVVSWEQIHRPAFYCVAFVLTFQLAIMFGELRNLGTHFASLLAKNF